MQWILFDELRIHSSNNPRFSRLSPSYQYIAHILDFLLQIAKNLTKKLQFDTKATPICYYLWIQVNQESLIHQDHRKRSQFHCLFVRSNFVIYDRNSKDSSKIIISSIEFSYSSILNKGNKLCFIKCPSFYKKYQPLNTSVSCILLLRSLMSIKAAKNWQVSKRPGKWKKAQLKKAVVR